MSTLQSTPGVDPFHPLLRMIDRYRRDVHQLGAPSTAHTLTSAEANIARALPAGLLRFLTRWNGAQLFRGALTIRSAAQLAPASVDARHVIVFADGPQDSDRWAFVADGRGELFGRWHEGRFEPLHDRFERWLLATIRILDADLREPEGRLSARLDADPDGAWLLLRQADSILAAGNPEEARKLLHRATALDPGLLIGWARLGDTLIGEDDAAARWAYLKALRAHRIPAPWPGREVLEPGILWSLARLFPAGDDGWERELSTFLRENISDVHTPEEGVFVEAVGMALARVLLARAEREPARQVLIELLERSRSYRVEAPMFEAALMLAGIEADLGHHDDAERRLRLFRGRPLWPRALLVLGRMAMMRQEPWAEEILAEAQAGLSRPVWKAEAALLLGERHLRQGAQDRAELALHQAQELARPLGSEGLEAAALIGLGDLARIRGDGPAASQLYREARAAAGDHPELLQRILVRRGDLYAMTGDAVQALSDYQRAAESFAALSLPIREAWARLRMARLGAPGAAEAARALFKASDLAAGVAASDAMIGDPAASLGWHLERAAEHARSRSNAQRARPPLIRADADRPERRIGAHRSAIAACPVSIVRGLSAELERLARVLDTATSRLSDPNLARYVAAVDLLAAHRSYESAEALLQQLAHRPAGLAGRALVSALARSPNAALVDGLLECLEAGGEPSSLSAAAEVLGWRREPEAVSVLRRLSAPGCSPMVRRAAIVALGRIGDVAAVPELLPALEESELAEVAAVALLLLGEWRGLDDQAQSLASQRAGTSRSLGEIVGRYGGPSYLLLLLRTADLEGPAGLGALQGLGYLGDPRVIPRLIEACASRQPQRTQVASAALEILTGHHESTDESLLRNRWLDWWESNRTTYLDGQRYRHGDLMSPGLLIRRMGHDDPLVRRSCYDELVISTGARLPFDPDGPWRVQVAHLRAWRRWWDEQDTATIGRWTFHGSLIG